MASLTDKVNNRIYTALSDAQRTTATHSRAAKLLLNAYTLSPNDFCHAFIHALNRILIILSRDPPVERLVQFVANFTASHLDTTGPFCSAIVKYLTIQSNAKAAAVRFRTLQIIANILRILPEDFEFTPDLWDLLMDTVMDRSLDKVPRVRVAAAGALCRLQTTGDQTADRCTAKLIEMMSSDSSPTVRKAAIQTVALTDSVIPHVLRRLRDVSADVRRALFETLAEKLPVTEMSQKERLLLLKEGLRDRVKLVRETCRDKMLLGTWMQVTCEGNIFQLVELLGCDDADEADVLRVLKVVFESQQYSSLIDACKIDVNNLTHVDVLVLRGLAEAKRGDGGVDRFIPTTLEYANVLRYYAVDEIASRHLLELSKSIDISDEAGRKALEEVIRSSFLASQNIGEQIVGSAVRAMRRIMMEGDATSRLLLEIIRQDILVSSESEESVEDQPLRENQEWATNRALNIALESLRISQQGASSSSAVNAIHASILELAVLPHLMSTDEEMRKLAVECVGLFCLLDKTGTEALNKLPLFIQAFEADVLDIQELALKVVVDMLMVFDFTTTNDGGDVSDCETQHSEAGDSGSSHAEKGDRQYSTASGAYYPAVVKFISLLYESLTHPEQSIRTLACQGLARLLYIRRLAPTAEGLSRLVVVYHNPITECDDELRQSLSVFFPAFAGMSGSNRLVLEDAFMQTISLFLEAPTKSPLSTVSAVHVAEFLLHLTLAEDRDNGANEGVGRPADEIRERLTESLMNNIIDSILSEDEETARVLTKIVTKIELLWSEQTNTSVQIACKLAKQAIDLSEDRSMCRQLKTWVDRVESTMEDEEMDGEDEQDEGRRL